MKSKTKAELIEELVAAIRESQTATDRMDEAGGRAMGINRTDGRCIDVVQRAGRITAGRLGEEAGLSTGAVTAALDRLEARGYLRRLPDPEDRRRTLVEVTELTEERTAELWGPLGERGVPALRRHSREQLEAIVGFLRLSTRLNLERAAEVRAERGTGSGG